MQIAFVRHGQTAANAKHHHQVPDEPLTAAGVAQVQESIPELKAWQPTLIISSPLGRARHSAHIIGDALACPVAVRDEFRELRRPLSLYGKHHLGFSSAWYIVKWFFRPFVHINTVTEGESYPAFLRRLERARSILEQYPEDARIVVVSHSIFINFFTFHVCSMKRMSFLQAVPRFLKVLTHRNARVTYLSYSPADDAAACSWHEPGGEQSSN